MASTLALKRLASSNLLRSYFPAVRPVGPSLQPASSRLFNTNARWYADSESDDVDRNSDSGLRSGQSYHRHDFPFNHFTDVFVAEPRGIGFGGLRRGYDAKETEDVLQLRFYMPGLGKEHVSISVEQNAQIKQKTLIIEGQGDMEPDGVESPVYSATVNLPEKPYDTSEIKAEMTNGVLKLVVPKVKEEEKSDVFRIKVD